LGDNGVGGVQLLLLLHRFWCTIRASSSQVPLAKDADELRSEVSSFCSIGPYAALSAFLVTLLLAALRRERSNVHVEWQTIPLDFNLHQLLYPRQDRWIKAVQRPARFSQHC
jgi:hypothetical protein